MSNVKQLFQLDGKVAIVTGASKGIGESIAEAFAEYGAKVVVSSRKQHAVDEVAANFQAKGYDALAVECHVGHQDQLQKLVDKTIEAYGGIDIIVNNAATNPFFGSIEKANEGHFDKTMQVNLRSCFTLPNLAFNSMKSRGGGAVINISSIAGLRASYNNSLYCTSKAALIMLTKCQARDWGDHGIRVNAICPGLVKTKISEIFWKDEALLKQSMQFQAIKEIADPVDMAGLAVFLASDASKYVTGSIYVADGGRLVSGTT